MPMPCSGRPLVHGNAVTATPRVRRDLTRSERLPPDLRGLNVYGRDGRLVLSTTRPDRVGRRRTNPDLRAVVKSGQPTARIVDPIGAAPPVVKIWAPLHSSGGRVVGAAEVALDDSSVTAIIEDSKTTVWYAVGVVFGVLWLVLALLVRGASARLRGQNEDLAVRSHDLVESSRELEATLLETIETLNAAVEARDPYTAGHSQRVRRVSLAIGRELRLPAKQLGALATAALFHDIGKIGMPDSILTKPERLDRAEAAIMRGARHARSGDRLADHVTERVRPGDPASPRAVGRPRLSRRAERNRHPGRGGDHRDRRRMGRDDDRSSLCRRARHGRGDAPDPGRAWKQFSPVVVDAFWTVSRRRPAEILPPDSAAPAVVAV